MAQAPTRPTEGSFYDLETRTLGGQPASLAAYTGKVTLVVNTASQCGFTPQYAGLQQLHDGLKDEGFAVLAFPSNDFGAQEPGSADEIGAFCERTYGVTFPVFAKVVTKPGPDQSPIYAFLGTSGQLPAWNFSKYVIGRDGKVAAFFSSRVSPDDTRLREVIRTARGS